MKRALVSLAALVVVALTSQPLEAQNVSGRWVLSVTLDAGSGDATFVFEQRGDVITGTYTGVLGEQKVTGKVTDGAVEFSFDSEAGTVTYRGKVTGDTIEGTCRYGQLGAGTFKGKKTAS